MPIFRKDGKNVLFIHVPKTGGSAIERVFRDSGYETLFLDGKVGEGTVNHLRRCTPQHMHGAVLTQLFKLHRFDAIFLIVRDPIARFRSEYLWRNRGKEIAVDADSVHRWARDSFSAYSRDHYLYDNHLRPQSDFVVKGATVYRFEDGLQAVIDDLNATHALGLEPTVPRVRDATSTAGHSSHDVAIPVPVETRLRSFYRRDFARFGYGGPRPRLTIAEVRARCSPAAMRRTSRRIGRALKRLREP